MANREAAASWTHRESNGCQSASGSASHAQPIQEDSQDRGITTAIETFPKLRHSLIRPSAKQCKRILEAQAQERKAQKREMIRQILSEQLDVIEAEHFASAHRKDCSKCPVSGIKWDFFSASATMDDLVSHVKSIASRVCVSAVKIGVTESLPWRYFHCEGHASREDKEAKRAYFHLGYSEMWALTCNSSRAIGLAEKKLIELTDDFTGSKSQNIKRGNDGPLHHGRPMFLYIACRH